MKILIGDKGNVDFDEPIKLSPEQFDKFVKLMSKLFAIVEVEESNKPRKARLGERIRFNRRWTEEELKLLLEIEDNKTVAEKLGRTWMSINIKRGEWIPAFMKWAEDKGYDIIDEIARGNIKKYIIEFMEEREREKEVKRKRRKRKVEKLKVLEKDLKSKKQLLRTIKLRIDCGYAQPNDKQRIAEIEKQIKEIEKQMKELKEQI